MTTPAAVAALVHVDHAGHEDGQRRPDQRIHQQRQQLAPRPDFECGAVLPPRARGEAQGGTEAEEYSTGDRCHSERAIELAREASARRAFFLAGR